MHKTKLGIKKAFSNMTSSLTFRSGFKKLKGQFGTSFLEMMIALVLMGVITTAIFKVYVVQHKNYLVQEDVTETQQSARASIDEIARNVRMAGYDLPYSLQPIVASNTNPDTITINFKSGDCETTLASAMPNTSAELKCASDVSCFYDDQWAYIYEPDSGGGEWFLITHVQTDSYHIQHNTMYFTRCYTEDAVVVALEQVKFYIDSSDIDHPNLMVLRPGQAPQVFAENITDLQFRYRLKNGMVVDAPTVISNIREVMISVTGRSNDPDYDLEGVDRLKSRTFSSSVYLRNL